MAIFEKNLRSIANSIRDEFIKKYILEFFLEKISQLTPNINKLEKKFYTKPTKSLKSTQKQFNETRNLSQIELKEFSFLYIIIENLNLFYEKLDLIKNVKIFTKENQLIFEEILSKLKLNDQFTIEDLNIDSQLIERDKKYASIKYIINNNKKNEEKIYELLNEIIRDLKNHELEFRIEELESKFSEDLSEATFNEIRELKKMQKIN